MGNLRRGSLSEGEVEGSRRAPQLRLGPLTVHHELDPA